MGRIRRIALSTGGGDAPGLNAVIRAAVIAALNRGLEVYGVRRSFGGLLGEDEVVPLTRESVRGITHLGGTILGTTNRGNPFEWPVPTSDESVEYVDRSDEVVSRFRQLDLDALVSIGGDGTLKIAKRLWDKGLPVIGVPKTIDNDIPGTVLSFGFLTAVDTATDAVDRLHSTAQSHERIMILEVMGRHAGWIALFAGLAGTADVILIPEIPYDLDSVCRKIEGRESAGRRFAVVVVAEGAHPIGGQPVYQENGDRLGGVSEVLAERIADRTGKETRALALRHLQRGGSPVPYDRIIALRFGAAAIECVLREDFGHMVALDPPLVKTIPLDQIADRRKLVPLDGDAVQTARALGVCLGD